MFKNAVTVSLTSSKNLVTKYIKIYSPIRGEDYNLALLYESYFESKKITAPYYAYPQTHQTWSFLKSLKFTTRLQACIGFRYERKVFSIKPVFKTPSIDETWSFRKRWGYQFSTHDKLYCVLNKFTWKLPFFHVYSHRKEQPLTL